MTFSDPQLQKSYECNLAPITDEPYEVRQVRALIAVHDCFQMMEGPHSSKVHEVIEHLLEPVLRPALRTWYQRPHANLNAAAISFREQLSHLAGEDLDSKL